MKRNSRFIIIALSLLAASSLLLTVGMTALAANTPETRTYLRDDFSTFETPNEVLDPGGVTPQVSLSEKFDKYLHKSDDATTVTVFSEEQYAYLTGLRAERKREALTFDEALYIISSSIDLYFSYDEVILTRSVVDGITLKPFLSCISEEIRTYHGDFSEYAIVGARAKYLSMISDIYSIIYYRLYVHDSGFVTTGPEESVFSSSLAFGDQALGEDYDAMINNAISYWPAYWDAYNSNLYFSGNMSSPDEMKYPETPETSPVQFKGPVLVTLPKAEEKTIEIIEDDGTTDYLFPTRELSAMYPDFDRHFVAEGDGDNFRMITLYDRGDAYRNGFIMSYYHSSYAYFGYSEMSDGMLKLTIEDGGSGKDLVYVFEISGDSLIFRAGLSDIDEDSWFDLKDGDVFKRTNLIDR